MQHPPRWRFDYCSNSRGELYRFEAVLTKLFCVKGKIRPCTTNQYGTMNYGVECAPLARIFHRLGVPCGEKVSQAYSIPPWILSSKDCFRRFVQRYFDCEGNVDLHTPSIAVRTYKLNPFIDSSFQFMESMRTGFFSYFGIECHRPFICDQAKPRKDGQRSTGVMLRIKKKNSLAAYASEIGFETAYKQQGLLRLLAPRDTGFFSKQPL